MNYWDQCVRRDSPDGAICVEGGGDGPRIWSKVTVTKSEGLEEMEAVDDSWGGAST